ncbi:transporter substrate-binding domain-containing protein [Mycobacterium sp. NPDC003449]
MTAVQRRWLTVLVAFVVAVVAGCTPSPPSEAPTALSRITQDGTIRVCSTGDYRPFTYRDGQGKWSGLDIEMAGDMAKRLGVQLELVPTTWKNLMADVGNSCDLAMGGISINLNRAKQALFSIPYLRDGKAAIGRCSDSGRFHALADIDRPGVRVIVNPGGGNAEFDKTHLHTAQVVDWPDNNTIFDQLAAGAADVMITDTSEVRWQAIANPKLCGIALDHPFTFEQKAYLIPSASADLQQWINQWLNIATQDGTYAALSQKYFGRPTGP